MIRHVPAAERSGRALILDVAPGRALSVCAEIHLPETRYRVHDLNPRGGTRGKRVIAVHAGKVLVASYHEIHVLDVHLRPLAVFTHPRLGMIHDLALGDDGVWAVSTFADALLHFTWNGALDESWRPSDDAALATRLRFPPPLAWDVPDDLRDPRYLSHVVHDVTHMNGLRRDDGGLIVSLGSMLVPREGGSHETPPLGEFRSPSTTPAGAWALAHAVVRVPLDAAGHRAPGPAGVLLCQRVGPWPNHNIAFWNGLLVYNDSTDCRVIGVDLATRQTSIAVAVPGTFLRAMVQIDERHLLVATQRPLMIHCIDLADRRVTESWPLSGADDESITSLAPFPLDI